MKYDSNFVKEALKERLIETSLNEYAQIQPLSPQGELEIRKYLENNPLLDDEVERIFNRLNKKVRWDKLIKSRRFRTFLSALVNFVLAGFLAIAVNEKSLLLINISIILFIVMNGYFILVSDDSKKESQ